MTPTMSNSTNVKDELFKQTKQGVVVKATPKGFKWAGSVQWPHPDDWEMDHWEFYRNAVFEELKKRVGTPPYDNIREDFMVGLRFTLEYGIADLNGIDIPEIVNGKRSFKPRFMTWFYNQWTPYVRSVLDPKD